MLHDISSNIQHVWQHMITLHMLGGLQISAVTTVVCTCIQACKMLRLTAGDA